MKALVTIVVLSASSALACDKLVRTVEFLGWTADSRMYAWRVHETCKDCKPKWVQEHTFVRTTAGQTTEYVTKFDMPMYPKPELPGPADFEAWLKQHPLVKAKPSAESPKNAALKLSAKEGEKVLAAKGKNEFCASKETSVELLAGTSSRAWNAGMPGCGCARGYWAPSGEFVAWLTGPASRVCDDCHGKACCREAEALLLPLDR